jgi:hypothetical protein
VKQPVVQIVHYSDMHIVGPGYLAQRAGFFKAAKHLSRNHQQGIAGADLAALAAFETFVADIASEQDWQAVPTWLVDTGDGTTFGDRWSLDAWLDHWSPRFRKAAGALGEQIIMYGNHDAWPEEFPLLRTQGMPPQRDHLRQHRFKQTWPEPPLSVPIIFHGGPEVQLYVLNSVDHDLWANVWARGMVLPDRYWQAPGGVPVGLATDQLDVLVARMAGHPRKPHLRLLAMHYPACKDATNGKRYPEILANRDQVAHGLANTRATNEPLVQVLLGGHTHAAFPPIGLLPNGLGSSHHQPLQPNTLQLVTASLSQLQLYSGTTSTFYPDRCADAFPHQCTLLRVLAEGSQNGSVEITLQRYNVGRAVGGAFGYLPVAEGSARVVEEIQLSL